MATTLGMIAIVIDSQCFESMFRAIFVFCADAEVEGELEFDGEEYEDEED